MLTRALAAIARELIRDSERKGVPSRIDTI